MKQLRFFLRNNKLFSLGLLAAALALGMELGKQPVTAHWLLGLAAGLAAILILWEMIQDARHGVYSFNLLGLVSVVASLLLQEYWAAMVIVLILSGGKLLVALLRRRATAVLRELAGREPATAEVIRKGKTQTVPVDDLHAGDKIVIQAEGIVPADALVLEGTANFDESVLTGEAAPQPKQPGSALISGSVSLTGPVTAKVTAPAMQSHYRQLVRFLRNAADSRAPFTGLAERYSLPFSLAVFALAGAAWALTGEASRFLGVIIVATPLPLLMGVPLALLGGTMRASRYGVIIKTGKALEHLSDAQCLAFEKTGILTVGEFSVNKIQAYGKYKKDEVLRLAASLEQNSQHAAAQAIITDAKLKQIKLLKTKHAQQHEGLGVSATLKGEVVMAGRLDFLKQADVRFPAAFKEKGVTGTVTYVAVNGHLAGYIMLSDELRPETSAALDRLRQLGVKETALLTGDSSLAAGILAKDLGLTTARGDLLPGNKLQALSALDKPVVFVGDGVQDIPLLTAADAGITLGAKNSVAAAEAGDVAIMPDDLNSVATAFGVAKRTLTIARQIVMISTIAMLLLMAVMATGKVDPLAGAGLQAVVTAAFLLYAMRAQAAKPSLDVHQQ